MPTSTPTGRAFGPEPGPGTGPDASPLRGPDERLRLVRRPSRLGDPPRLDDSQLAAVARRSGSGPLVVLGAPGTGKTTTLVECVVARVERDGTDAAGVLVLAPTRAASAALRDRVTARLARTLAEPLARTAGSYAFSLLRRAAVLDGEPAPRLISGPEQDRVLADLLAGHAAGEGRDPGWPEHLRPALVLRGFRDELRDLLMRALERGLGPGELADLGRRQGRPDWVAAARVLAEYLDVTALSAPGAFDPAAIVDQAVQLLSGSPELLAAERRRWALVAVDDHHESTEALGRLLDRLAGDGRDLVLCGDPDATTQGFRGAEPALLADAAQRHRRRDGSAAPVLTLQVRHRPSVAVAGVTRRVAEGVGTRGGGQHRTAQVPVDAPLGGVESAVLATQAQVGAYVARLLRQAHLLEGVAWGDMAVLVRSASQTAALRRALTGSGVPLSRPVAEVPVRDEPAVRPLRQALAAVLRPDDLGPQAVLDLLTSPLGGADAMAVRRLRQALLAQERAGGGRRTSDALLVATMADPERAALLPARTGAPARRVAGVLAAGRRALAAADPGDPRARAGTAETVLWALWEAGGLADRWQRQALAGGPAGRRADRDLDAVVALFEAAARFTDRAPGAGAQVFLTELEAQDVPSDTLAERAPQDDVVSLLTASAAAGREWDLVVVAGLQDGAWPDTRLRGSLLGAAELVDVLTGRAAGTDPQERRRAARAQVLADERRLLHVAVSRARRRLVAVAVAGADEQPSAYLDLLDPLPPDRSERPLTRVPRAVALPALVGELRSVLLDPASSPDLATGAAAELARLAAAGVAGADPADWYGLAELSDDAPVKGPAEAVTVSPSAIESFATCPLRWLLQTNGGRVQDSTSQAVGTLVHEIAHALPTGSQQQLEEALEARWESLGMPDTWVGAREKARARAMVRRLAAYLAARPRQLVGTEVPFDVPVGSAGGAPGDDDGPAADAASNGAERPARLKGRVDRLERDEEGRLVVVDLKTGSSLPRAADAHDHPQLGSYQVAVELGAFGAGERSGGAALVQVGGKNQRHSEQRQVPLTQAADPRWALDLVRQTADGMAAARFSATQQEGCRHCPVRSSCPVAPEGRQVG